jgi:hypothetical protein
MPAPVAVAPLPSARRAAQPLSEPAPALAEVAPPPRRARRATDAAPVAPTPLPTPAKPAARRKVAAAAALEQTSFMDLTDTLVSDTVTQARPRRKRPAGEVRAAS